MYRSGFSVLLLTIIVCAVGVALALSALSSSTQVARTNIDTANAATDESQARNCTEKVLAKLRVYSFYGGDETFPTEQCRVYTINRIYNNTTPPIETGEKIIQVKRGNKILETKIKQINPKVVIEYQKFVPLASLDSNNPYVIDPLTLKLWLKADRAESNNGQPVISIKNATDDIVTFNQVSTNPTLAPVLITNAINNRPALRFDGIDDFLIGTATSIGNTTGLTVIVVGKLNSVATNQTYISKFNALDDKREWRLQNNNFIATDIATAEQVNETVSFTPPNTNIAIITARWAPTTTSSININNIAPINANASFTDITSTDTPIIVGAQQNGVNGFLNGDIAEILVFNKKLTDTELITVNTYLNTKYAVYTP
jgi:hypothetical protein